jgi:RNA polymerase sporulation-specific sigma factor
MYLRKVSLKRGEISIDEPLNIDWDGNELLLSDVLGSDENAVSMDMEAEDERKLLCDLINKLKPREKVIMEMRFGLSGYDEHTQKEVADILGISQSYISRLEKRIIDSLRKEITEITTI